MLVEKLRDYQLNPTILRALPRWHRWSAIATHLIGSIAILIYLLFNSAGFFAGILIGCSYRTATFLALNALRYIYGYYSFDDLYFDTQRKIEQS